MHVAMFRGFLIGTLLACALGQLAPAAETSSIAPRRPAVPKVAAAGGNPIDQFLHGYYQEHSVKPAAPVADRVFARRVFLDVVGVLPGESELQAFLQDKRADKRERLVTSLLADNRRYAEHWLSFWNDALRNDYRGTGYIDGGRQQITGWLYAALASNMPYDQFVRELIDPKPESEGFVKGIVWRGVVNASQVPPVQAAQNVSQVFMGINLKCASCHDSFINDWKLTDSYGLASVFAEDKLEMHRCDQPIGEFAEMKFLYPELGSIDAQAPRPERLKKLAQIVTSRENGRLTRTIVNRLWSRFLGRGLVEPVDEMDNPAWNADLLDWLAADLADHDFDLKHTIRLILTSRAYQLPAVGLQEIKTKEFVFRGPAVRRMSAEQYVDAIASLTGPWPSPAAAQLTAAPPPPSAPAPAPLTAKWIWKDKGAAAGTDGGRIFLRKTFQLESLPQKAIGVVTCDNQFALYLNGKPIAKSNEWQRPLASDLLPHLVKGTNVLAAEAINWPDPETKSGLQFTAPNGAGFIFASRLTFAAADGKETVVEIGSDESWLWTRGKKEGWEQPAFKPRDWEHTSELAEAAGGPWNLGAGLQAALASPASAAGGVRAALTNADPLQSALGRTNREQVVTERPAAATTLQALELTNGATLAAQIERGANQWLERKAESNDVLLREIYARALGREPTADEQAAAAELVGTPAAKEGLEDFLWVLVMLPEFQLIY